MNITFLQKIIDNLRFKDNIDPNLEYLYHKKKSFYHCLDKIDTVFIGHSHGQVGLNPEFFCVNSFNLCAGSQDLYSSYNLYKLHISKINNIKNVVIVYSVFSPGYEMEKTKNKNLAYLYKEVFGVRLKYLRYSVLKKIKFQLMLNRLQKKELDLLFDGYQDNSSFNFDENIAIRDVQAHIKHNKRNNNQTKYLELIKNDVESRNKNFFVVIPPHSPLYRQTLMNSVQDISNDLTISFLFRDLFKLEENDHFKILNFFDDSSFKQDDFVDFEHLNLQGSEKLSKMVNDKIVSCTEKKEKL